MLTMLAPTIYESQGVRHVPSQADRARSQHADMTQYAALPTGSSHRGSAMEHTSGNNSSGLTLPNPPVCFRLKVWGNMWHSPPDPIEDFVLMQDPKAKDAWAIISSLSWSLQKSKWFCAGRSAEQLARELRRNSFKVGSSQNWVRAIQVMLPDLMPRPPRQGWRRETLVSAEVRKEELMRRVARYEHRSRCGANMYWATCRKIGGLSQLLVIKILRFLELRVDALTGPLMYCMRCKEHWNLGGLLDHVANSAVHIDAAVA